MANYDKKRTGLKGILIS